MPTTRCGFDDGPTLTGQAALALHGPILEVEIGFDAEGPRYYALVDTGASESCIDSTLAIQLGLPVIDQRPRLGASGEFLANIHLARIHVPALKSTINGRFAGVDLAGHPYRALIGRTFLQHFTMVYEGRTGTVTLSND